MEIFSKTSDANGLYATAMADKKSILRKIKSEYVFTKDMNDQLINAILCQSFTECSAFFRTKYYRPEDKKFNKNKKGKKGKVKVNRIRNWNCNIPLTNVDNPKVGKIGEKFNKNCDGLKYKKTGEFFPENLLKSVLIKIDIQKKRY